MKKGEKITSDTLEELGWILCHSRKGLEIWANGTLRLLRRVKNELILGIIERSCKRTGLTRTITDKDFMQN